MATFSFISFVFPFLWKTKITEHLVDFIYLTKKRKIEFCIDKEKRNETRFSL